MNAYKNMQLISHDLFYTAYEYISICSFWNINSLQFEPKKYSVISSYVIPNLDYFIHSIVYSMHKYSKRERENIGGIKINFFLTEQMHMQL